jgi:cysteine desulfuration protein SufE
MFDSCLEKQQKLKDLLLACSSEEEKYEKIIELGRQQPPLSECYKTAENLVSGCQSQTYLHSYELNDKIIFEAASDALISAGLAALLIKVYSEETTEVILKCPPTYLDELGIRSSLTPNRANGLYSMHLRMKQDALKIMVARGTSKNTVL